MAEGLTCLIKVGAEADQNYQNYILRGGHNPITDSCKFYKSTRERSTQKDPTRERRMLELAGRSQHEFVYHFLSDDRVMKCTSALLTSADIFVGPRCP
ncbi:hypothetical protein DNTS_034613 [Danionella cerebrum]|uniref:Uncharacterized protein n=1 Tax=Danionella cerebrum TaxID=2873325 RepID=A0A553N021_9TELE|nr:hypothetical protein DNTS_034613 [Danionella translucida]